MSTLAQQRCLNHALREAVARCPECRRFYCRECVTEHEDRMICASCLRKLADEKSTGTKRLFAVWRGAQFFVCLVLLWVFFFLMGQALLNVPSTTHFNSLWVVDDWEEE